MASWWINAKQVSDEGQCVFGVRRSFVGWLSVRFDGGPYYPEMVEALRGMVAEYGHLVRRGERLTAFEWLQRIKSTGAMPTDIQVESLATLMGNGQGLCE